MDGCVEEPLAPSLGALAVAWILFDIRDHARIENAFAIVCGIKAGVEIDMGASEVQTNLLGHLLQRFQTIWQQHHIRFIHWRDGEGRVESTCG